MLSSSAPEPTVTATEVRLLHVQGHKYIIPVGKNKEIKMCVFPYVQEDPHATGTPGKAVTVLRALF